ncbi:hypothetical protein [Mycobacterium helveticum]|jgi:hypothetical protein|uniref:hypothetical protein n=1 Tax=Mycobacterium helveticum TaxID=2592811 RepID=UPI00143D6028|nr:hypothetical protein [Mycobacterium helveticum]
MSFIEATRERVQAATGFVPTLDEQRRIDADATRSAAVLFGTLPRPPLVNEKTARKLRR